MKLTKKILLFCLSVSVCSLLFQPFQTKAEETLKTETYSITAVGRSASYGPGLGGNCTGTVDAVSDYSVMYSTAALANFTFSTRSPRLVSSSAGTADPSSYMILYGANKASTTDAEVIETLKPTGAQTQSRTYNEAMVDEIRESYKYIFFYSYCAGGSRSASCYDAAKHGNASCSVSATSGTYSATLNFHEYPVISGIPTTKTIKSGSNTISATIGNATSQVWQLSLDNGATWTNLDASPYRNQFSGYNTNELTITPIGLDLDNSLVRVFATNNNGPTTSSVCSLQLQKDTFVPNLSATAGLTWVNFGIWA